MNLTEVLSNKKVAFAVFFVVSVLFLLPLFSNISNWGSFDWDQHFFYHGSARNSIMKFGQFPLWNPFYCGGTPLLANPQSVFLSPSFLFVLLFGTVVGLKLEILAYLVLGLFGMFLLARRMGIKLLPAYVSAVVFMLSSWFFARVLVGHTTFLPFALVPWAVLFYLHSSEKRAFALFSAVVLAFMFFAGGVYPLYFTALFLGIYALLEAIEKQNVSPLVIVSIIFLFAALFSAVKLVPMLQYTYGLSYEDTEFNSYSILSKGLFSREQDVFRNDVATGRSLVVDDAKRLEATLSGKIAWGWHEYSAYIGVVVLLLFLTSFLAYKRNWKLLVIAIFFLFLSLGDFSPLPLWDVFRQIPLLGALHGPSRLMIMFVFVVSLVVGKVLSDIKPLNNKLVVAFVFVLVLVDLFFISRPLVGNAFNVEPMDIQTDKFVDYVHIASLSPLQSQYPNMLQNMDTVNCYERIHPSSRVKAQLFDDGDSFPGFIGNVFIAETNRTFNISSFFPNKVVISVENASGTLVYNENYMPGWKARGKAAFSHGGLIAANVTPSDSKVEFYYSPESFYIGALISILSAVAAAFFVFRVIRWRQ